MYYSHGNYEAFARPKKPQGVDQKKAYLVGGGLASLAAAAFLIRDGQMDPKNITIFEASKNLGGALDGSGNAETGWKIRGGREMENHFECLWDLYRSIPSLEIDGSVLDEFYWLNKEDPNYSMMRTTRKRGKEGGTNNLFGLTEKAQRNLVKLVTALPEDLYDKTIEQVMSKDFLRSNFWLYWRTMFAFEQWHSALEMKLYIERFIHHLGGLPDMSALKFTKYNEFDSLVRPLAEWLKAQGIRVKKKAKVVDVQFTIDKDCKVAKSLTYVKKGKQKTIELDKNDLVFVTNGSLVENSSWGDHHTPAKFDGTVREGGSWSLWQKIAAQDPSFGNPYNFCGHPEESQWESATLTVKDDRIRKYIKKIAKRGTNTGKVVTGGVVTARDSNWLLSWTVSRQPHFPDQPDDQTVVWLYSLFTDKPGNYIKKSMRDCTGQEIAEEWLYHLGVEPELIHDLAADGVISLPCMMPFVTSLFLPRDGTDRPKVVPEGAQNFAFIGQFAETSRDCVFTTEYSVRTAMEAVYTLLGVDRGVPEVYNSVYDVRQLMKATAFMRDQKGIDLSKGLRKIVEGNTLGLMLAQYQVLDSIDEVAPPSEAVAATGP